MRNAIFVCSAVAVLTAYRYSFSQQAAYSNRALAAIGAVMVVGLAAISVAMFNMD